MTRICGISLQTAASRSRSAIKMYWKCPFRVKSRSLSTATDGLSSGAHPLSPSLPSGCSSRSDREEAAVPSSEPSIQELPGKDLITLLRDNEPTEEPAKSVTAQGAVKIFTGVAKRNIALTGAVDKPTLKIADGPAALSNVTTSCADGTPGSLPKLNAQPVVSAFGVDDRTQSAQYSIGPVEREHF